MGTRIPPGVGANWGLSPTLKCITLCKQQTPQQNGAADLSAGDSASQRKHGFRMDSPAAGVTSAGRCVLSSEFFGGLLQLQLVASDGGSADSVQRGAVAGRRAALSRSQLPPPRHRLPPTPCARPSASRHLPSLHQRRLSAARVEETHVARPLHHQPLVL